MDRNKVIDECIDVLKEKRETYRSPEFSYPNGCLHSIVMATMHIKDLEDLKNTPAPSSEG